MGHGVVDENRVEWATSSQWDSASVWRNDTGHGRVRMAYTMPVGLNLNAT